jgi:hypothetical protein
MQDFEEHNGDGEGNCLLVRLGVSHLLRIVNGEEERNPDRAKIRIHCDTRRTMIIYTVQLLQVLQKLRRKFAEIGKEIDSRNWIWYRRVIDVLAHVGLGGRSHEAGFPCGKCWEKRIKRLVVLKEGILVWIQCLKASDLNKSHFRSPCSVSLKSQSLTSILAESGSDMMNLHYTCERKVFIRMLYTALGRLRNDEEISTIVAGNRLLRCDMNFQCHSLKKFLRSTAFAKILRSN